VVAHLGAPMPIIDLRHTNLARTSIVHLVNMLAVIKSVTNCNLSLAIARDSCIYFPRGKFLADEGGGGCPLPITAQRPRYSVIFFSHDLARDVALSFVAAKPLSSVASASGKPIPAGGSVGLTRGSSKLNQHCQLC
jgi:hypothetical protein